MAMPAHVAALVGLLGAGADGRRLSTSVPGCWDALTALLIEQAGFPAAFLTGGGLSMARLGRPDMGLVTATETADAVAMIRDRVALPLIVDGDTGFGNALNVQRTVRTFERAGASAIVIEDQGFPKRSGHMTGKTVVPPAEAAGRIAAACDAREAMLVIARTDAVAIEGIVAALDRAEAYLAAGADLIFVEGPRSLAELGLVADRFAARVPLVVNLVEGGSTPADAEAELAALGIAIALHPLILMHGLAAAAPRWLAELAATRSTAELGDALLRLPEMSALVGATELIETGRRYDR